MKFQFSFKRFLFWLIILLITSSVFGYFYYDSFKPTILLRLFFVAAIGSLAMSLILTQRKH